MVRMYVTMRTVPNLGFVVHVIEVARSDWRIRDIAGSVAKGSCERLGPLITIEAVARSAIAGGIDKRKVGICYRTGSDARLAVGLLAVAGVWVGGVYLALRSVLLDGIVPIAGSPGHPTQHWHCGKHLTTGIHGELGHLLRVDALAGALIVETEVLEEPVAAGVVG